MHTTWDKSDNEALPIIITPIELATAAMHYIEGRIFT
jgi:hypothetical protein